MQGEYPCKMWSLDGFEIGLMVVGTFGSFDCVAEGFVFIPFVEVYFW
jgi:hypothetical protein